MKTVTIGRYTYTMRKTGYGQYEVRRTTKRTLKSHHSTDSQMYDWMNDDSNKKENRRARKALKTLFT
jgi:hypothetical protein